MSHATDRGQGGRTGAWSCFQRIHCQDGRAQEPTCTPACGLWGSSTALLYCRFSKPAPMFLDDSFRKWARIREFVPPFGIKGQGRLGTLYINMRSLSLSPCTQDRAVPSEVPMLGVHPSPSFSPFLSFL